MDIYNVAVKYKEMLNKQYRFLLAYKKKQKEIIISLLTYPCNARRKAKQDAG